MKAVQILAMLIGAGADTTASVLQGFFKIMALNPGAVQKAHEGTREFQILAVTRTALTPKELDRVVGPNRLPNWEDETSLPYLRSLVKEVHRFNPIGSLGKSTSTSLFLDLIKTYQQYPNHASTIGVPHTATKEDVYEGKTIPKGTIVFPNGTALSNDVERYPNPEAFEPDRFKGDGLTAAVSALHKDHLQRDHFHYGFGRRMCPGVHVAEASLFIVISRLLWGFDIKSKPGHHLDMKDKRSRSTRLG